MEKEAGGQPKEEVPLKIEPSGQGCKLPCPDGSVTTFKPCPPVRPRKCVPEGGRRKSSGNAELLCWWKS
jgi:hypothetical protein